MKKFLSKLYPIMRVFVFMGLIGCGSLQTVNGVTYRKPIQTSENVKMYTLICVSAFGFLVWGMYNERAIE